MKTATKRTHRTHVKLVPPAPAPAPETPPNDSAHGATLLREYSEKAREISHRLRIAMLRIDAQTSGDAEAKECLGKAHTLLDELDQTGAWMALEANDLDGGNEGEE